MTHSSHAHLARATVMVLLVVRFLHEGEEVRHVMTVAEMVCDRARVPFCGDDTSYDQVDIIISPHTVPAVQTLTHTSTRPCLRTTNAREALSQQWNAPCR